MISTDQETELHRFFGGALAAAMGLRSSLGGQLAVAKAGISTKTDGGVVMDEESLEAAWEYSRIEGVLRTLSDGDRRVLRLLYEPLTPGEFDRLETFGRFVRLAVVLAGGDRERLVRLCKRSKARDAAKRAEAAAVVYSIVFQATARGRRAQDAYEAGCVVRAREDYRAHPELHGLAARPWYVPSVSRDRAVVR